MNALATLAPLSVVCGVAVAFVFRRFTAGGARQTVDRILAHVMELRLFLDEPRLIWNAQCALLRENLRLFAQIAVPSLITVPLIGLVMWQADRIYGRAPLRAGEAVVVTARVGSADPANVRLEAPASIAVETPGVRALKSHEVSWQIRPRQPFNGVLKVNTQAGSIEVPWPHATVLGMSWIVWFLGISSISALIAPRFLKRGGAILLVLTFTQAASAAEMTPVILISVDTLRADHLSAYGYTKIRTPGIDAIANNGTIYQRIDTQIPLTLPSHTVLMTSTYPLENHVEANAQFLPPEAVTLASVLHANGYRTAAFIGSMILDKHYGLDKGFDIYDSPFDGGRVRRDAALVTRAARQWISNWRNKPFFAFVHLYDLHTPYALPQVAGLTPTKAGYDAELQYVDQVIERLHTALAQDGVWDKALVILLADHGESLGDHGETSHGFFIYESTMHVPLIIHWPGDPSKKDTAKHPDHVTEGGGLIDVAPTILEFLQIPAPSSFQGVSLLSERHRMTYGESVYAEENFGWAALRSIQSGTLKYISAPRPELYDVVKDPGERLNVLSMHAQEAKLLKAQLDALVAKFPPEGRSRSNGISPQTREVLGSLGYTAGGKRTAQAQLVDPKDKIAENEAYENGLTLLYSSRYDKAIAALQALVKQDAKNLPALCALGEAWFRSGNDTRALVLWQQALERDPKYRPAAESIGGYWLAQKDYNKACGFVPDAPQCKGR